MPTESKTVDFPDENLEAAIREYLGKEKGEEITAEELATLPVLEGMVEVLPTSLVLNIAPI
jgi:hypothetical protein